VRSADWRTHSALVFVQVAFATQAVEGKLAMTPREAGGGGIHPLALAMARMLGAALVFQIVWRTSRRGGADVPSTPLRGRDHAIMAGLSLLGIVVNQTLFLVGLSKTTSFSAALLACTIPVLTAGLAAALGQERLTLRTLAGLGLAVAGVLWLTGIGHVDVGAVIVSINCLAYSGYIVLSRSTVQRLGALTLMTWIFTWGAVAFLPFGGPALVRDAAAWSARSWGFVTYVVTFPTILAYLANAWALGRSTAGLVTVYIYLQPLLAAVLQWFRQGQSVGPRMLGAAALILAGVTLVAARRARGGEGPRGRRRRPAPTRAGTRAGRRRTPLRPRSPRAERCPPRWSG
jgi:drug/metabolite transporter (DMT)-like permease